MDRHPGGVLNNARMLRGYTVDTVRTGVYIDTYTLSDGLGEIRRGPTMMISIARQTITFHRTEEAAAKLAAANQEHDDEAEYRVERGASGWFVAVYEDGERIGTL